MRNDRGSIMIVTVGFILVFTLFGMSSIYFATVQNEAAEKRVASTKAFWLAEAGIQKALWAYKNNQCDLFVGKGTTKTCSKDCLVCGTKTLKEKLKIDAIDGEYEIEMNNTNTIATSTGSYPGDLTALSYSQRKVRITSGTPFSNAVYAVFAREYISLNNGVKVDSYKSDPSKSNEDAWLASKGFNGDVGSNGQNTTTPFPVTLLNNTIIDGDVSTGPGGVISGENDSSVHINGSITHENSVDLPPVIVPANLKSLPSSGSILLNANESKDLPEGDYQFSSINLSGTPGGGAILPRPATLRIKGKVNIYATGSTSLNIYYSKVIVDPNASLTIYTDGQVISTESSFNNANPPKNLTIFSTYTSPFGTNGINMTINNGPDEDFSGAIYAPDTSISFSTNTNVYGAVIGKSVVATINSSFHYDEALGESTVTISSASTTWQEL